MKVQPRSFSFSKVPSPEAEEAFRFHSQVARSNEYIWPRTRDEIMEFSYNGSLFGVRQSETGKFVALCYVVLDPEVKEWEIGGLTVADHVQNFGIGTFLMRIALAHTIAYACPLQNDQEVIAFVHEANNDPRRIMDRLGFEKVDKIELPGKKAPSSMKRNAAGNVVGDKLWFTRDGLRKLARWFDKEFDGTLGHGRTKAKINLGPAKLKYLKKALRKVAQELDS